MDYGGIAIILQEGCQEFEVQGIQALPLWPLCGLQAKESGAIDCVLSLGGL